MIYEDISILCVEDDELTAKIMCEILKQKFGKVLLAHNGLEALELYKTDKPDIVLTDIMMPKLNGLELIKKLKKIDENQKIAVITAYNENEYFEEVKTLGVKEYIFKPIDKNQFFGSLDKLVKNF